MRPLSIKRLLKLCPKFIWVLILLTLISVSVGVAGTLVFLKIQPIGLVLPDQPVNRGVVALDRSFTIFPGHEVGEVYYTGQYLGNGRVSIMKYSNGHLTDPFGKGRVLLIGVFIPGYKFTESGNFLTIESFRWYDGVSVPGTQPSILFDGAVFTP